MSFRMLAPVAAAALGCCLGGVASAYDALGPGAIIASVRDRDGRPLFGAFVTALGPAERHATTSNAGIVTLAALPLGTYRVRVVRAGYETTDAAITLTAARGFGSLVVRLARSDQGTAPLSLSGAPLVRNIIGTDPSLDHVLVGLPNVDLPGGAYATAPYETKVTLDGIPLGGPSSGAAALRPDALTLSAIGLVSGPDALAPSLDGLVGGDIDLRTLPAGRSRDAQGAAGYDSNFGSFQQIDAAEFSGPAAASIDAVVGGGLERDRVLRTAYALSGTTSLGFDSYRFDRNADETAASPLSAASEPAYSARLSTRAFGGALDVRSYGSDSTAVAGDERFRALAAGYERKFGAGTLGFSIARSADSIGGGDGVALRQTTTATGQLGIKLGQSGSLALADTRTAGTAIAARQDPHVALSLPLAGAWTMRATAGSAYVSAPYELVAANPAAVAFAPETSFGYRAGADLALAGGSTLSFGAFGLTRWNRFASLASARSQGLDLGYARTPASVGWGLDAGLGLARDIAYGPAQPASRVVQSLPFGSGAIPGVADTRARLGLSYKTASGLQFNATALSLGPNNGITDRALRYADVGASVPLLRIFSLRIDSATPLGSIAPRTLSLSLGAATSH